MDTQKSYEELLNEDRPQQFSEREFAEILNSLEDDDIDLSNSLSESLLAIREQDEDELWLQQAPEMSGEAKEIMRLHEQEAEELGYTEEEMMPDCAWGFGPTYDDEEHKHVTQQLKTSLDRNFAESRRRGLEKFKQNSLMRRAKRQAIKRIAFDQQEISLTDTITPEETKFLISTLTSSRRKMVADTERYITRRIEFCLNPLIPRQLRNCFSEYKQAFIKNPGFMYEASKEYGGDCVCWVTPDIPAYFAQGTEMQALKKYRSEYLYNIDRAVQRLVDYRAKLAAEEIEYAARIVRLERRTYLGLVKTYPTWFLKYYEAKFNKVLVTKAELDAIVNSIK